MPFPHVRWAALAALALVPLTACAAEPPSAPPAPPSTSTVAQPDFAPLERDFDARLGVYAIDTGSGREIAHRADERFGYASTHKAFSTAAVLQRTSMAGLAKVLPYTSADVQPNSPVGEKHAGTGLSLRDAIDAALRYSDNTAANLLFRELGGPAGLAAALRGIGDTTTHVDRIEPGLNDLAPGDVRDTSTPRAMAADLRAFALGTALPAEQRTFYTDTMRANRTGDALIRAGTPAGWTVADKTGTGAYATRNDIAVVWPPGRAPIVLVVLSDRKTADADHDDRLIAQAAKLTLDTYR
ncbi:class A beta-lactamase [Amycolatopsis sp. SID8362]|uniref:class A beta-lactamase n=1 Tax=Amycolatopsis sp. SID8362 TaxID=2690346 RepID=UPI00136F3329|nr:class A beta-lactamase [Amycolatopsis sp. SID8362]NBH09586.1 class A beta-lactamase [Amycolatopsis sp. SID8362]NED46278.1 class A beta-lactamase [Amycolatopsis sp. SID8362]